MITQVKDNQETLCKQITQGCRIQKAIDVYEDDWEKGHGRLERRRYEVFEPLPMLKKWKKEWPFIRQVIRVTRYRERLNSRDLSSEEVHYFASNGKLSAQEHSGYIRGHWHIENKLNYVKDVAFHEDGTVKRVNPIIFSTCIDFVINLIRHHKITNVKQSIYEASLDIFKFISDNNMKSLTSRP